jgi:hypothetical protein
MCLIADDAQVFGDLQMSWGRCGEGHVGFEFLKYSCRQPELLPGGITIWCPFAVAPTGRIPCSGTIEELDAMYHPQFEVFSTPRLAIAVAGPHGRCGDNMWTVGVVHVCHTIEM